MNKEQNEQLPEADQYAQGVNDGKVTAYTEALDMVNKLLFRIEHLSHSIDDIVCGKIRNEVLDIKGRLQEKLPTKDQRE
jgi:hypothetical protein